MACLSCTCATCLCIALQLTCLVGHGDTHTAPSLRLPLLDPQVADFGFCKVVDDGTDVMSTTLNRINPKWQVGSSLGAAAVPMHSAPGCLRMPKAPWLAMHTVWHCACTHMQRA